MFLCIFTRYTFLLTPPFYSILEVFGILIETQRETKTVFSVKVFFPHHLLIFSNKINLLFAAQKRRKVLFLLSTLADEMRTVQILARKMSVLHMTAYMLT